MNDSDIARAIADRLKGVDFVLSNIMEMSSLNRSDGNLSIKILSDDYTTSRINTSMGKVATINVEMGDETFMIRAFVTNVMTEMRDDAGRDFITIHLTLVKEDEKHAFALTVAAANTKQKNNRTVWRNRIH